MFVSLIIVFREAMEAGLIVGIVLAATQGVTGRGRWIAGGVATGVAGASLVAAFAAALSDAFEGAGQEVFTAAILCFAVLMLSWHILWMSHHARTMTAELRQVGQAVRLGQRSLAALAAVVAVAALSAALLAGGPPALADGLPTLVFHNHRFEPARIEVPAHVKFRLQVRNIDNTADEFESVDLNREKLVPPGQTITVFLGPLDPGQYKFFGDFHPDTAQGVIVAK